MTTWYWQLVPIQTYILVPVIAYLLGSIPFGYILVRLFRKQDVRTIGSGNIGATNVARSGARGLGIATLILDMAKGFTAVALAEHLFVPPWFIGERGYWQRYVHYATMVVALAAIFAILGHMYPVWLKFKGGKGVATGVGVFLALAPIAVGIVLVIFIAVVWLSRYVSLGSIIATAAFPILAWLIYRRSESPIIFLAAAVAAILIIARHHQNIRRLLSGTEHRLGEKKQVRG